MSLRGKLLLLALSMLVLPLAGWQLLRQMEALLREGQEQALLATAETLARAVAHAQARAPVDVHGLYVHRLPRRPALDGDDADWGDIAPRRFQAGVGGPQFELRLGRFDETLFAFVDARVQQARPADAHWPTAAGSDHLLFDIDGPLGALGFRLANAGAGPLKVTGADGGPATLRLHGHWRPRPHGFSVEWQLPQGLAPKRLGLQLVDADEAGGSRRIGTASEGPQPLWPLVQFDAAHAAPLAPLLPAGMRARLLHAEGWLLAEAGALPPAPSDPLPWWRRQLYRHLLHAGDPLARDEGLTRNQREEVWQALSGVPAAAWRRDADAPRLLLSAAVPIRAGPAVRGAVLVEREQQTLLLTDRAFGGLLGWSLLALLAVGFVVFGFASRLSWRIRDLARATESALSRDGRVRAFPASRSSDEIGDLSRRFARLLGEIAASQDYLRSLAGKLSHELNTPIAIVRGALDNIDPAALPDADRACIERARSGADRLAAIVRTMSEASRIEQAIEQAEAEDVDIAALLGDCADGYRPLLSPRRLELALPDTPLPLRCAPDLVVQALDKLIDNARGFAPADGWVRIAAEADAGGVRLRVANRGPALPEAMRDRLFDSMVSLRQASARGDGVHLGFGLYVVRLVAELHGGRVEAINIDDGVEFRLWLHGLPR